MRGGGAGDVNKDHLFVTTLMSEREQKRLCDEDAEVCEVKILRSQRSNKNTLRIVDSADLGEFLAEVECVQGGEKRYIFCGGRG